MARRTYTHSQLNLYAAQQAYARQSVCTAKSSAAFAIFMLSIFVVGFVVIVPFTRSTEFLAHLSGAIAAVAMIFSGIAALVYRVLQAIEGVTVSSHYAVMDPMDQRAFEMRMRSEAWAKHQPADHMETR